MRRLGEYTYALSFNIEHPDAELSGVSDVLGLKAQVLWKKGEPRVTPKGRALSGTYQKSSWSSELGRQQKDLPAGLQSALTILRPHKDYLAKLVADGAKLRFFVGWFSDFNARDVLDWQLLQDIAALKISLDLDVYGGPDLVESPETKAE